MSFNLSFQMVPRFLGMDSAFSNAELIAANSIRMIEIVRI